MRRSRRKSSVAASTEISRLLGWPSPQPAPAIKRKPGRPRKEVPQEDPPRKRGRPRKDGAIQEVVKRKRGRPRKEDVHARSRQSVRGSSSSTGSTPSISGRPGGKIVQARANLSIRASLRRAGEAPHHLHVRQCSSRTLQSIVPTT